MKTRRYRFAKYGSEYRKKMRCPNCGKLRFVPYWDEKENKLLPDSGRCDRENSCGYWVKPDGKSERVGSEPLPVLPRIEINKGLVTVQPAKHIFLNSLYYYFSDKINDLYDAFKNYQVGTAKDGSAVFWQIDKGGVVRTGKVIKYDNTGHRDKSDGLPVRWVHRLLKIDTEKYELKQCLFGEHLLEKHADKKVAVVESEKTAVLMSILQPDYLWLAVGGSNNIIATEAHITLKGRDVYLFPDVGMFHYWARFAQQFGWRCVNWSEGYEVQNGDDILDVQKF